MMFNQHTVLITCDLIKYYIFEMKNTNNNCFSPKTTTYGSDTPYRVNSILLTENQILKQ